MLNTVNKGYAKARIAAINAQIKEHKDAIKRLEAQRRTFTGADQVDDAATADGGQLAIDDE